MHRGAVGLIHPHPTFDTRCKGPGRTEDKVTQGDVTHFLKMTPGGSIKNVESYRKILMHLQYQNISISKKPFKFTFYIRWKMRIFKG